jgi:hypothetical protein
MSENRNTGTFSAADLRRRMAEREAAKEMRFSLNWAALIGWSRCDRLELRVRGMDAQ